MYILITLLVLRNLYVNANYHNVKYRQSHNTNLGNILSNAGINLRDLKQLSKTFPNHAIEIQIEGTQGKRHHKPNYYIDQTRLRGNTPYRSLRLPIDAAKSSTTSTTTTPTTTTPTTTTPTTTTPSTTTTMTTTTTTTMSIVTAIQELSGKSAMPQQTDSEKRPLYMEDLIRALEEYEMKNGNTINHRDTSIKSRVDEGNRPLVKKDLWELQKSLTSPNCNSNQESSGYEQSTPAKVYRKTSAVKNFNDVLKLMRRGVKVKFEVTTPADMSNEVTWVPIKIQREFLFSSRYIG